MHWEGASTATPTKGDRMIIKTAYRAPSIVKLCLITTDRAKEARELLKGYRMSSAYKSVQNWTRQCYHAPSSIEQLLCALNEVLGGYGVEYIANKHIPWKADYAYINMGDTYAVTLLYKYATDSFLVGTWGDVVERKGY